MCMILWVFEVGAWALEEALMIVSAFFGAAIGGFLMAGFFGRQSEGYSRVLPLLGFLGATFIGSALGGVIFAAMALPLENITLIDILTAIPSTALFCVVVVMGFTPAEAPWTVLVWLLLAAAVDWATSPR